MTETLSETADPADGATERESVGEATERDAPEYDAVDRYWIVRQAVEDALMNVFWTFVLLGFGLALLAGGVLAMFGNGDSQISLLVGVALVGLGVGNVAVALDVSIPFLSAD
ncbi:hypothetical protein C472_02454 [Halorubrum tebenquichense DSM 14210]|uniref:Uncharacterized protein n=1 Tax=Halorubrum tebenquichense DSM 14210 TaxID=1227485 RepID=M0DWU9_9EURY|nr:hypothetical protein C472_02454 [Halorubrum tebenquichense DSM 14210]